MRTVPIRVFRWFHGSGTLVIQCREFKGDDPVQCFGLKTQDCCRGESDHSGTSMKEFLSRLWRSHSCGPRRKQALTAEVASVTAELQARVDWDSQPVDSLPNFMDSTDWCWLHGPSKRRRTSKTSSSFLKIVGRGGSQAIHNSMRIHGGYEFISGEGRLRQEQRQGVTRHQSKDCWSTAHGGRSSGRFFGASGTKVST